MILKNKPDQGAKTYAMKITGKKLPKGSTGSIKPLFKTQ